MGVTLVISNRDLLESAIALPHQSFYLTFWDKLAAMVRSIAANHALLDGNKRLALAVLHSSLCQNHYWWVWSQEDAYYLILRVAQGETGYEWIAAFLEEWCRPAPQAMNSIPKLMQAIKEARQEFAADRPEAEAVYAQISAAARGAEPPEG